MWSSVLNLLAVIASTQLVQAITINTPAGWKGNQTNKVTWTTNPGDPSVFSIELANDQFNEQFALANNVDASFGSILLPLPQINHVGNNIPFTLQFVNISDATQVFATSPSFTIEEQDAGASSTISGGSTPSAQAASAISSGASTLITNASGSSSVLPTGTVVSSGSRTLSSTPTTSATSPASSTPAAASMNMVPFITLQVFLALLSGNLALDALF